MKKISLTVSAVIGLLLGGCATIVGESMQEVSISSDPSYAIVVITDEQGDEVFTGETPALAVLKKSSGRYWGGKNYLVRIYKDGYINQAIPILSRPNLWYIGGNVVFGGVIGWFIVDPLNGGMYTLSPKHITAELGDTAHNDSAVDGNISAVLPLKSAHSPR